MAADRPTDRLGSVAAQLRRAVNIAAAANQITTIASGFRLTTLNAAILTTQGGPSARGFAQVAEELRRFSEEVNVRMTRLTEAALAPVTAVSSVLKYARLSGVLDRTAAQADSRDRLRTASERVSTVVEANLATLGEAMERVRPEVERAVRASKLGRGLARAAKIEAARCTEHSVQLMQVSEEFEVQVERISELLQIIQKESAGGPR